MTNKNKQDTGGFVVGDSTRAYLKNKTIKFNEDEGFTLEEEESLASQSVTGKKIEELLLSQPELNQIIKTVRVLRGIELKSMFYDCESELKFVEFRIKGRSWVIIQKWGFFKLFDDQGNEQTLMARPVCWSDAVIDLYTIGTLQAE